MIGVIEHLPNPNLIADEVARLTRAGGILIVLTENTDSLLPKVLKSRWNGYMPPEHLSFYSPKSLSALMVKRGFVLKKVAGLSSELRASLGGLVGEGAVKAGLKMDLNGDSREHSTLYGLLSSAYRLADRTFRMLPIHDRMICTLQRV
jgi:hypothetical protein